MAQILILDLDGGTLMEKEGVLGQTIVPSFGPLEKVEVAFDIQEEWFVEGDAPLNKIDFSSTAIHEIGHAIGIDHSEKDRGSYECELFDNNF